MKKQFMLLGTLATVLAFGMVLAGCPGPNNEPAPETTYTVTVTGGLTGGSIDAAPKEGKAGDTITLTNTPADDYIFSHYTVGGEKIDGDTFPLVDKNVTVGGVFQKKGVLTITGLPAGSNYAVTVYGYAEIVPYQTVYAEAVKAAKLATGTAASEVTALTAVSGGGVFLTTGTYLVVLASSEEPPVERLKAQVVFTSGSAAVEYADLKLLSELPAERPTTGELTITGLPASPNFTVAVYGYDKALTYLSEYREAVKAAPLATGTVTGELTNLTVPGGGAFSGIAGTGNFLVVLTSAAETRVIARALFDDGGSYIKYADLKLTSALIKDGELTVTGLPASPAFTVTVYNYAKAVTYQSDYADAVKAAQLAAGTVTAEVTNLTVAAGGAFSGTTGTGTFAVVLASATETRVLAQVAFSAGSASVKYADLKLTTALLKNGELTVTGLPASPNLAVAVYTYATAITYQTELTAALKTAKKAEATVTASVTTLKTAGDAAFSETGAYLLVITTPEGPRIKAALAFTGGNAAVAYGDLKLKSALPAMPDETYANHKAMLQGLGINPDSPPAQLDPSGNALPASYNPLGGSSASGAKVTLFKQSEIFVADIVNPSARWTGFIEDLKDSNGTFTTLSQNGGSTPSDPAWTLQPKATIAGDFDGDGLDEVLVAVAYGASNGLKDRIVLHKVQSKNRVYSDTDVRTFDHKGVASPFTTIFQNADWARTCISGVARDFDGDGKDEVILIVGDMIYLLDDNFNEYASFASPNGNSQVHVAAADYDQDGLYEYVITCASNTNGLSAVYYIYDDWTHGGGKTVLNSGNTQVPSDPSSAILSASVVTGDFDGDGLPETLFSGVPAAGTTKNIYKILILDTEMDTASKPVFSFLNLGFTDQSIGASSTGYQAGWTPGIAAGDMDGDGRDEFFSTREVCALNEGKTGIYTPFGGLNVDVAFNCVEMGDVTGDKKADIVMINNGDPMEITVIWLNESGAFARQLTNHYNQPWGNHRPAFCLPNVDNDSYVLSYTGHELLYTDPIIETVIASPPYWEEANNGEGGTTYGQSSGQSGSDTHSGSHAVGLSIGADVGDPLGIFEAEFKVGIETTLSWGVSKSTEITESWAYSTGVGEDKVVFTAVPYDVYYYKIITAPANAVVGLRANDTMTINVPRKPGTFNQELNYYNAHNGSGADVTLNHVMGNPFSYYKQNQVAAIKEASKDSKGNVRGLYSTIKIVNVGVSDTGSTSQSVEQVDGTEISLGFEVELSREAEMKVAGATVGASEKFGYGYEFSTSVEKGVFIEGEVPDIPPAKNSTALSFRWGLLMYPATANGQTFNLVTYWVDK